MIYLLRYFFKHGRKSLKVVTFKAAFLFIVMLWYATSGYLYFESTANPDLQWKDGLWWALVTMTTVGYGDLFPTTTFGRFLVGFPVMFFGVGLLGYILSAATERLIEAKSRRLKGMLDSEFKNHIVIFNMSIVDRILHLLDELAKDPITKGKGVVIVDEAMEELPPQLDERGVHFVRGNPTQRRILQQAGVPVASHAIILSRDPSNPHSDDSTLSVTLMTENLNPAIYSIAECVDPEKIEQLKAAGCDSVVCATRLSMNLVVQELQDPGVQDIVDDLISNASGHQLYIMPVKRQGKTMQAAIEWGRENGYVCFGYVKDGRPVLNPDATAMLEANDSVILMGVRRPADMKL